MKSDPPPFPTIPAAATHAGFVAALEAVLIRGGVDVLAIGFEIGPGCIEMTLRHRDPSRAADDTPAWTVSLHIPRAA